MIPLLTSSSATDSSLQFILVIYIFKAPPPPHAAKRVGTRFTAEMYVADVID